MVVYVIVNSETLKIYIGQHKRDDGLKKYLSQKMSRALLDAGERSHLYRAMRKHQKDSWSIHPLVSGIEDKKELDETEQLLIYALKSQHPDVGYNICDGGEGYTGPGYWLGKQRPGFKAPMRPGWRNSTTFEKGSVPWNKGKATAQAVWNKGKKMIYTSEDARQRSVTNLISGNQSGRKRTKEQKERIRQAHLICSCPHHVAARMRKPTIC